MLLPFYEFICPRTHVRLKTVRDKKPCGKRTVLCHIAYLCNVVFDALPAQGIRLLLPESLHASGVFFYIHRQGQAKDLHAAGRDAQPCGKITDDALPLLCVLQEEVHWQDFKYADEPTIPRFDDSVINIRDWQTALQVVICGREGLRRAGLPAENEFFYVQF